MAIDHQIIHETTGKDSFFYKQRKFKNYTITIKLFSIFSLSMDQFSFFQFFLILNTEALFKHSLLLTSRTRVSL